MISKNKVSLAFDLYLMNVGSSRIGELLDYLGVKTVTGTTWESGTINGMFCNEKYKGDFHLQKYYTPENKRNHNITNINEWGIQQWILIKYGHKYIWQSSAWYFVHDGSTRGRNTKQEAIAISANIVCRLIS